MNRRNGAVYLYTGFNLVLAIPVVFAQTPRTAPHNPAFLEYLAQVQTGQRPSLEEQGYGLIPLPVDLSYLLEQARNKAPPSLPSNPTFDLRTLGRVTPVRNQIPYATCWAFGTFGSMESVLLPAESWDFSENNLANLAGFDFGFNSGGNASMSMAYLARWGGPVAETADVYPNPGGSPAGLATTKHVQQVRLIPPKQGPTQNDEIKQALQDGGALYVTYYHTATAYNSTHNCYLYRGSASHNHAVTLIGWDDTFDRYNFSSVPEGNGAYLVKNSWGTSWGDGGYFYISYYDTTFAHAPMFGFFNAEATSNYTRQYSYDPLGWVNSIGDGATPAFWGANVFTALDAENLSAVGFYANSIDTSYLLYIYTNVATDTPRSGSLAVTKAGTCPYPGYGTVSLDTPVALTAGQRFSIVLQLTTPGYNYPHTFEYAVPGYSSHATASAGESYYSFEGTGWADLTTFDRTANFCIKGYMTVPPLHLMISRTGGTVTLTWSAGVLQQADTVTGSYTDVPGATSPYTTAASAPQKFFRLRSPP